MNRSQPHPTTPADPHLARLLGALAPTLYDGVVVFATLAPGSDVAALEPIGWFREREGCTVVLDEARARDAGLTVRFRAAWITLGVDSELESVGLTAAVASALAGQGIGCNVIAAVRHDHLFVPVDAAARAMAVLDALQRRSRSEALQSAP